MMVFTAVLNTFHWGVSSWYVSEGSLEVDMRLGFADTIELCSYRDSNLPPHEHEHEHEHLMLCRKIWALKNVNTK